MAQLFPPRPDVPPPDPDVDPDPMPVDPDVELALAARLCGGALASRFGEPPLVLRLCEADAVSRFWVLDSRF
jgi:hypothetical protein